MASAFGHEMSDEQEEMSDGFAKRVGVCEQAFIRMLRGISPIVENSPVCGEVRSVVSATY